jgi:hypothetical protein
MTVSTSSCIGSTERNKIELNWSNRNRGREGGRERGMETKGRKPTQIFTFSVVVSMMPNLRLCNP